jgi:hypothetical protein
MLITAIEQHFGAVPTDSESEHEAQAGLEQLETTA